MSYQYYQYQYSFNKEHGRTHAQATWNTIIQYLEYTEVEGELSVSSNNCHVIDLDSILEMTRSARVLVAVALYSCLIKKLLSIKELALGTSSRS